MELLLENVKNTIFNKNAKAPREAVKISADTYARVAFILIGSFLLGRTVLFYSIFPCGIALITVLMSRSRANIYALPIIIGGILTNYGTGYDIAGDTMAAAICGVTFFLIGRCRMSMVMRAFIATAIMVLTKSIYFFLSQLVFIYDVFMMCVEALMVLGLIYVFSCFYNLMEKESKRKNTLAEGIVSTAVLGTLIVGGIGVESIAIISPAYLAALMITLFIGYKMGVMEGGIAGIASGITVMLLTSGSPAVVGIFACAGMVAGFFQGQNRMLAGTCFAAVCLAFGLVKGYPELYISIYDPLLATAIFILLPAKVMNHMELLFAKIRRDDIYYELIAKDKMKHTLKGYLETFERLSILYAGNKNSNAIIGMQFKGLTNVVAKMIDELTAPTTYVMQSREKYNLSVGVAGYAKEDNVSGDCYVCAELKDGEYMIALSDGMGKGQKAYNESALTITSLYNMIKAGFDVELALKTINSLLLTRSTDEIFSTVDMGIFNKSNGKLKLFKIGAAATFVKRGDQVEIIKVSALPMGIVDNIRVNSVDFQARRGDEIIIVSDGITEADRNDGKLEWIKEAIANIRSKDPQTMSDLLINKAIERYGLKEKDDMTVITAVIK